MLHVVSLPYSHYYYSRVTVYSTGSIGYWPDLLFTLPSVVMVTDPTFSTPVVVSRDIQLGWISEEGPPWGILRDKAVQQLGIEGTIVCSNSFAASAYPGDLITAWGSDAFWTRSDAYHDHFGPGGIWVSYTTPSVTHSISAKFEGDNALLTYYRSKTVVKRSDEQSSRTFGEGMAYVWVHRTCGPNGSVLRSRQYFSSGQESGVTVTLPNGVYPIAKVTSANYTQYGVTMTNDTYPLTTAADLNVDVSADRADMIVRILKSQSFMTRVWQNFISNGDPFDTSSLGTDILKDLKYVDASILLTVFDLIRFKANLSQWKNLMNLFNKFSSMTKAAIMRDEPGLFRKFDLYHKWQKLAANTFLSGSYGVMPNISDIMKIINGVIDLKNFAYIPNRLHARRTSTVMGFGGSVIVTTSVLTVEAMNVTLGYLEQVGPLLQGLMQGKKYPWSAILNLSPLPQTSIVIREMKRWGVYPNVQMLADAIPYSFIPGWVITQTKALDEIQAYNDKEYIPILYTMTSQKRVWSPPLGTLWPVSWASGAIQFKYYYRNIQRDLPLPPVQVGVQVGPFKHWAEAFFLVVQKLG